MLFSKIITALSGVACVASEFVREAPDDNILIHKFEVRNKEKATSSKAAVSTTLKAAIGTTLSTSTKSVTAATVNSATASSTDGASCTVKRTGGQGLNPSQMCQKQDGEWLLYEDDWVTAVKVQKGDRVAVTDVKGCTAVFFWNSDNIPSAYHLYVSTEVADAEKASGDLADMGSKVAPVHVTIAANGQDKYDKFKAIVRKEFPDLDEDLDFTPLVYNYYKIPSDKRNRYDAVAGTREVTVSEVDKSTTSRQPAGKV